MCVTETQTLGTLQDKNLTVSDFGVCANIMISCRLPPGHPFGGKACAFLGFTLCGFHVLTGPGLLLIEVGCECEISGTC